MQMAVFCLSGGAVWQHRAVLGMRMISSRTAHALSHGGNELPRLRFLQTHIYPQVKAGFIGIALTGGKLSFLKVASRKSKTRMMLWPNPLLRGGSIVFRDLFRCLFLFARRRMRSHIAIAGIKEQAAADDCAKHYQGHGVVVPLTAEQNGRAYRKNDRYRPYWYNSRSRKTERPISEFVVSVGRWRK
jgi:hypothetical protein